ncbi:ImmA/IrrE family metallo-endopeptidase [Levilactobacillus acidifarinae]|uniref:ImmA/IrrE family metallo-endopeptidase n=1 Tax=Levilactobacillus acidifarinae TaxID=267364 RepID=UPI0009F8A142|nr:ImmA/IrrE family metallo-endopeptidase [Levilactobacillus acidifarinae]GEO70490.1 hypothetical protein LAC03_24000 [Levilactobacillus acidifarinae]
MQRSQIRRMVVDLVKKYQTNDPLELCQDLDIPVNFCDLGENIMGFRTKIYGVSSITINSRLNSTEQKITCGHELGHDRCSHDDNADFLQESTLYSRTLYGTEYEANCFMVELMFADNNIDDYADTDTEEGVLRIAKVPEWAAPYVDWSYVRRLIVKRACGVK